MLCYPLAALGRRLRLFRLFFFSFNIRPLLTLSEFACQKWPFLIKPKNPLLTLSETPISDNAFPAAPRQYTAHSNKPQHLRGALTATTSAAVAPVSRGSSAYSFE